LLCSKHWQILKYRYRFRKKFQLFFYYSSVVSSAQRWKSASFYNFIVQIFRSLDVVIIYCRCFVSYFVIFSSYIHC
jgi:hypothetical protein